MKHYFLKSLFQNFDFFWLFRKFWLSTVMSLTQKWLKKAQIVISCTNVDRKMRIKSKRYFHVNYSFMKLFSQNFEALTQCCNVINPELTRKRIQTGISCTNGDRKTIIKNKKNFEVRYSLMKLFSGNFKILAPCQMSSFQNQVKKTQVCISGTTGCKNIKVRENREHYYCYRNISYWFFLSLLVHNVQIQVQFDPILR